MARASVIPPIRNSRALALSALALASAAAALPAADACTFVVDMLSDARPEAAARETSETIGTADAANEALVFAACAASCSHADAHAMRSAA